MMLPLVLGSAAEEICRGEEKVQASKLSARLLSVAKSVSICFNSRSKYWRKMGEVKIGS